MEDNNCHCGHKYSMHDDHLECDAPGCGCRLFDCSPPEPVSTDIRNRLAVIAHDVWSGWMRYLFDNCQRTKWEAGPRIAIPADLEDRWRRQMDALYVDLSEEEKESDRKIADRYLAAMDTGVMDEIDELRRENAYLKNLITREHKDCNR